MPAVPVQQNPAFLLVGCNCKIHFCWCDVTNPHDCWPRVSLKRHVCRFSTTLLNTRNVKDVKYDEQVALRGHCSVILQQICLWTWYYSIKHGSGPLEIKEKSYLTDTCPSDMPTNNVKLYQPRLLHCQYNIHHAVKRVVMSLQLQHI